ncbi:succinate-semialdehyde dehydrogenase / glutarate-semialdehyde dehydrogenase [Variovorax sp. HW608]|uniref:NAD-dependent succinate-semialdehyde dehydrogenase n=1 Tax=Variovorax sp. HW608 TaxID=1034889 RepID=UPI00081FE31A|nr:NAD-dependent succinate-semialdehyde dehydrogenase [Variovorax sp. HW608]SCK29478.1 succinate-semialdehyde dehydrogenase / glutarate-semialdehyde dehydrogenase [Variovorax sp. HW608]
MLHSINPATGETLASFEEPDARTVDAALARAADAQRGWRKKPAVERARLLGSVAEVLRRHKEEWARLATLEMGKPIAEARAEVEKSAVTADYYAANAPKMLDDVRVASNATDSRVVFDPLGLVLAVMPWNYAFWQAIRAAVPAIAAGNGVVLKHAANVPQCALALQTLFSEAGAPDGLFTTLLIGSPRVSDVIDDPRIAGVTFTGSTPAGRAIASQAAKALKKQVLELGGSDPFIVLADADVEAAAAVAVKARFQNNGQSCIAAKRFIVEASIGDRFAAAFAAGAAKRVLGDPLADATTLGPMARGNLRDELDRQVRASIDEGATLGLGGKVPTGPGFFYPATVLDHVSPQMTVAREETFGPAAAIMRVRNADDAVALANGTEFGLGAALWTGNAERARALSREIDAGAVFVNGMVASDARLPFGGVKHSGYGRELGIHGLHEFTNVKTVWTGPAV